MWKKDFSVCLLVLGAAMLMGIGSAQQTGTTQVTAQYASYISVEAPAGITTWDLTVGDNSYPGSRTVTIASNYDGDVLVSVRDERTGFVAPMVAGRMTSDPSPAVANYQLENPLRVGATTTASLSAAESTIYTLNAPGREQPAVTFDQQVTYTDYAADYHMIITFIGTVTV